MDQLLVRRLREEVAELLARQRREDAANGLPPMTGRGRAAVRPRRHRPGARGATPARRSPPAARRPTPEEEEALAAGHPRRAVRRRPAAAAARRPRGREHRHQRLRPGLRRLRRRPRGACGEPVAESDDELVELIQILGAYSGLSSRPVRHRQPAARPAAARRLPAVRGDGRLPAAVGVDPPGPAVARSPGRPGRQRHADARSWRRSCPPRSAARKNIMIAGATNAGKTTLLRALANEIPPHERLITVERALELGLDEFPDLHPNVVAFEERLPNSEGQGAITHGRAGPPLAADEPQPGHRRRGPRRRDRHHAQRDEPGQRRLAVDDPRQLLARGLQPHLHLRAPGAERLPIEATHDAHRRRDRLRGLRRARNDYSRGGTLRRFVTSVREVNGVDGRVLSSEVFAPGPDGYAVPHAPIACLDELRAVGYQPGAAASWVEHAGDASTTLLVIAARRASSAAGWSCSSVALTPREAAPRPGRRADGGRRGCARSARRLPIAVGRRRCWSCCSPGWPVVGRRHAGCWCSSGTALFGGAGRGATGDGRGWRRWPPGPSRCATPSPARSAWSRRSPPRRTPPRPRSRADLRHAGRPAAHPDAAAGRAAAVRRRARRRRRRPDRRRADPQLPAARPRPARRARRRWPSRRARSSTCASGSRPSAARTRRSVQIVVGVTVAFVARPRRLQPRLRRAVRHAARPGRAGRGRSALFAAGFVWLRRLARFDDPGPVPARPGAPEAARDDAPGAVMLVGGRRPGSGLFLLVPLFERRPGTGAVGAGPDRRRAPARPPRRRSLTADRRHEEESARMRRVGSELRGALQARGVTAAAVGARRPGLVGRSLEGFLATGACSARCSGCSWPSLVLGAAGADRAGQPRRSRCG